MKNKTLLFTVIAIAATAFGVGCKKTATSSQQLDKVQEKTTEAAREMRDYAYAQKDEFVANMKLQLADLNRELDQLAIRIERSSDAVKAEARPKLDALRAQIAVLNKQLDQATNASESSWDNAKGDFKKSYEASKEGFQQARQWLSEKIAP
jgi:phage host-nuclease inhibitor protein Gam